MKVPEFLGGALLWIAVVALVPLGNLIVNTDSTHETNITQKPETSKVSIKSEVNYNPLAKYISKEYTVEASLANEIVHAVYDQTAYSDFPSSSLVLAVIAVESSFRVGVESHKGAVGLMQLMPVHDPDIDVQANIASGIWVLKMYRLKVPTDKDALHAYNLGIGAFNRGKRSHKYVSKVLDKQQDFVRF